VLHSKTIRGGSATEDAWRAYVWEEEQTVISEELVSKFRFSEFPFPESARTTSRSYANTSNFRRLSPPVGGPRARKKRTKGTFIGRRGGEGRNYTNSL